MSGVIGIERRMHKTFVRLILVMLFNEFHVLCTSSIPNQNQVIEHLKLLSQMDNSGLQPSRLRALLVNDLRNILVKNVRVGRAKA